MANILNILDKNTGKYVSVPAIQGASAYDVAVSNGFEGSEQEWLESLKGDGADIDMSHYATISYVDEAVSSIDINGADINLDGYATEDWTKEYLNENIETISSGYYEAIDIVGEDITDDIIEANGELPTLPTYFGGTRYIVNGGIVNMMVNPNVDDSSFYINDYENSDINQNLVLSESNDGNCSDYLIYGAYNADLLTKTDLMRSSKATINKYANLNSLDGYYPSVEYASDGLSASYMCGWSFYGNSHDEWMDVHLNSGTISKKLEDKLDQIEDATGVTFRTKYSDGHPQTGLYRRCPCVYFRVQPYTTYTINYTGDVGGDQDYMKGLHWKILSDSPSGGGCWDDSFQGNIYSGGHTSERTVQITTDKDAKYLCVFVGRVKSSGAYFDVLGFGATKTSDSAAQIDTDIVKYNIEHLSVVQGTQTYEYYIDMIKNIPFKLSITAMSVLDESVYSYYELNIPYIMSSNQYFRFERDKEMFAVTRALQKAVGMRLDEINNTYMNYEAGTTGVIGKWIDSKDIYRCVMKLTLPEGGSTSSNSSGETFYKVSASLPDVVDTLININQIKQGIISNYQATVDRYPLGYNYDGVLKNDILTSHVSTTTPFDGSTDFYSTLTIKYGSYHAGDDMIFVIEYTKYEMDEEGNIT